ncbi:MAG TPA: DUF1080 domain-containing protein [Gemmataceae bacterium]|jgi:hypothetical protein|nr:DUF1080 domain-containing protein [Gemmataceae bacterium]
MRMIRCLIAAMALAAPLAAADPKDKGVWTDPEDSTLPVDFKIQGEYTGDHISAQVIALNKGTFQAVVLPGGLPGAGWDGKHKILMAGTLDGTSAKFEPASGKRKYLAKNPDEFSASSKFPPEGQKDYSGTADGSIFKIKTDDGKEIELKKTTRTSNTMGAKPPQGAIVLFDGSGTDAWSGGRVDEKTKFLNTDGQDIKTKQNFNNYTAHVEFMIPYRPEGRGQERGNSGFYQVHFYEVQVLDSFGLDGKDNECGGVYTKKAPTVNMCLPPLAWQTYDAEFTNAVAEAGKVTKKARLTLKHNGVMVHDNIEISGPTGGHRSGPEGTPGPLLLQGHGNPLQYRNIWVVEKK